MPWNDTIRLKKDFENLKEIITELKLSGLSDEKIALHFTDLGYVCSASAIIRLRRKYGIEEMWSHSGNSFRGKKHTEETKSKISKIRIERGLAKGEKNSFFGRRGENSPGWRGGFSKEERSFYDSSSYDKLRLFVLGRDRYTCQSCGVSKESNPKIRLNIHHIIPIKVDESKKLDQDNVITLCSVCHGKIFKKELDWASIFQDRVRTSQRCEESVRNEQTA